MAITSAIISAALFLAFDNRNLLLHVEGDLPARTPALCATESPEEAVTIRIWNSHGGSSSGGSGAIIGTDGRRALVLSCDHIFGSRGVGKVSLRGHGWQSPGFVVARDRRRDLSLIVGKADASMPVAKIHIREAVPGDRITLTGCGGNGVIVSRTGAAIDNDRARTWSRSGDSGGPAFLDGRIVGVVWGTDGGTSYFVPLRHVYSLGQPVDSSAWGDAIYQKRNGVELTGILRGFGRAIFGPRNGGKWKGKGYGQCGPDGCQPFAPPGGQSPGSPPTAPGGEPWYAPGFGPGDQDPDRPAPEPPDIQPEIQPIPDPPPVTDGGRDIHIDLSGFVKRPELEQLERRFDERVDGLASKADIEIVIGQVENLGQTVTTSLTAVNQRIDGLERTATEPPPVQPQPKRTHWILIADATNTTQWSTLMNAVNEARSAGRVVETIDANRIDGLVAAPQLIRYVDRVPSPPVIGVKEVSIALGRLATGG